MPKREPWDGVLVFTSTNASCGVCGDAMTSKWTGHGKKITGLIWCNNEECGQYRKTVDVFPAPAPRSVNEAPPDA